VALNPVVFTENVVANFLRYQVTTYPFADRDLYEQLRKLLSLDATRATPLLKGPFVSLSRAFREGASVETLVNDGVLHPHMRQLIPFLTLRAHQEKAIRAITSGKSTLVSTGTGSGKTEAFLYPIISRCLALRDANAAAGVVAVLVYPMNALAEDQLQRLRDLLAGSGITFGMYVGKTPESGATGELLPPGSSQADYLSAKEKAVAEKRTVAVHPPEERCSRELMRTSGEQPRILLTNVKMLEYLLTREKDVELFDNAQLEFLVFDEAHTFSGSMGAETACLIRRLRTFCGRKPEETVCVATSATIVDPQNPDAARDFAARFFGIDPSGIVLVGEEYEAEVWKSPRTTPHMGGDLGALLHDLLGAIEDKEPDAGEKVSRVHRELTGDALTIPGWEQDLYNKLSANEVVYQLNDLLGRPRALADVIEDLGKKLGREIGEEELLIWLTLGAAARSVDGRPLLRPVMHAFIRGIGGAGVTFPENHEGLKLSLSIAGDESKQLKRLDLTTCSTCGQHYFVHFASDFSYMGDGLQGGEAVDDHRVWKANTEALGGKRLVLIDRVVSDDDDDAEDSNKTTRVFFCRHCGALHDTDVDRCDACGEETKLIPLWAIEQSPDHPGYLTRCLSCSTNGRPHGSLYREPARPVRAVDVSDIHVLAQDMIQNSDPERRRLLLFADNRQDAAFQAGWMRDHARRFRLRALMAEKISQGGIAVGDLTHHLDDVLEADIELSKVMVPEVWTQFPNEAEGQRHADERKRFLRIQVLREITTAASQRVGLEPWGRLQLEYSGLTSSLPFVEKYATQLGVKAERMLDGVASLLDTLRRRRYLFDQYSRIYSRIWEEGDREIQRGYLPLQKDVPKGLKLEHAVGHNDKRIDYLLGKRENSFMAAVRGWGLQKEDVEPFIRELWSLLLELKILAPVDLKDPKGRVIKGTAGSYQLDVERMRLTEHHGLYRCGSCRRAQVRPTPNDRCPAWRCVGKLQKETEDADDYNLRVIDERYEMIRPREHTAMVPPEEREELEREFKGARHLVNTLVCTPTLELGVDIGALDSVLLRNVPPLPANYWQRVGRAGRRHRMAVNLTYARSRVHDQSYFEHPDRLLEGRIDAPKFNLRNDELVRKHVHSAMLAHLRQLSLLKSGLPEHEREQIREALNSAFPAMVRSYLWDASGSLRHDLFDVTPLTTVISKHRPALLKNLKSVFEQGWPADATALVDSAALAGHIDGAAEELKDVVARVKTRLDWNLAQQRRLEEIKREKGTLEEDEEALYRRCERFIKRLRSPLKSKNLEGFDISYTFNVLASESYLPGYGLETGSVMGMAGVSSPMGERTFPLPRPTSVALREYVPGNRIYANSYQFTPRTFHFEQIDETLLFSVDPIGQTVTELGASSVSSMTNAQLRAVPMCDVELVHTSHISDEEEIRFQLPVMVLGYEQGSHAGGTAYDWNGKPVHLRRQLDFRLVNAGAKSLISKSSKLGYPVCLTCGQSRSPFASDRELIEFAKRHNERGHTQVDVGFFADVTADTLTLPGCESPDEAYTLTEILRTAAAEVLQMEQEDLQILVIGQPATKRYDAHLYDPMPGGSGLLDQICLRFDEIVIKAIDIASHCPSDCERACIDCLMTFRNAFYSNFLDRKFAITALEELGPLLVKTNDIPAKHGKKGPSVAEMPVNDAEARLKLLLERAHFPDPEWHREIKLKQPLKWTIPDAFYESDRFEGIAIYLDGLSRHIHGNPSTASRDAAIRSQLEADDYQVIAITATELYDKDAMVGHLARIARRTIGREKATEVKNETGWWADAEVAAASAPIAVLSTPEEALPFIDVEDEEEHYRSTVPLMSLKAAAGSWGDPDAAEISFWVRPNKTVSISEGMFVARVTGHSMEPRIPDGSWCLFKRYTGGSRSGRIVLAQHNSIDDPETGGRYTVKKYESKKSVDEEGWKHEEIRLLPLNSAYQPIVIKAEQEDEVVIIAELVDVL
jgi:ATP-dependent helicase YprA (DUF1998 family)/SOS-response transcriptional repressor LexA